MARYPTLEDRVLAVTAALSPLPDGYYVEGDEKTGSVLVCCKYPEPEGMGFAITMQDLEDGVLDEVDDRFAELVNAVEAARKGTIDGALSGRQQ